MNGRSIFIPLGLLILGLLYGCQPEHSRQEQVFLGGQIINSSHSYVKIFKDSYLIDSLALDRQGRFQIQFDSLESGMYNLEHLPHIQTLFLEKGDSIWVRINASDFEESVVFSGIGASKNNFLIELDLEMNQENSFLSNFYAQNPETFKSIIDSLIELKHNRFNNFKSQSQLSAETVLVTQSAYLYPYATRLERYALLRGTHWDSIQRAEFFKFRDSLNLKEHRLAHFRPYISYLMNYLNQKALDSGQAYFKFKDKTLFNLQRLNVIDRNIQSQQLRNILARAVAFEEILNFDNHDNHEIFLGYFLALNTSPKYTAEIVGFHDNIENLQPNMPLPEVRLSDLNGNELSSNELFSKQTTVLYFWSQSQMPYLKKSQERIVEFQKQFPQVRFVGVCLQPLSPLVKDVFQMMGIDPAHQYALANFQNASERWVITLLNKAIVIGPEGKVINGFANFASNDWIPLLE